MAQETTLKVPALHCGGCVNTITGTLKKLPTYYVLLGWAVAAANPLYGAVLSGVYGLGRVLPAVGIGALITAGFDRRKVSHGMTSLGERASGITNGVPAAMGSYLIVLFGGVVPYRTLAL